MTSPASKPALTKAQSALLAFLFGSQASTIAAPLTGWIPASPRYAAFVEKYKDKVRKKLRVTREKEAAADLLYELQIPYWLLQDKRFDLAYEPYAAGGTRGPDYSVTFRANFTFNLEITHVRGLRPVQPEGAIDLRLVDVLCGKLRQMLAGMANVLFVVATSAMLDQLDLVVHLTWIKQKAEGKDPEFFARQRFSGASEFFKNYQRLSALVLHAPTGPHRQLLWVNPQARFSLPDAVKAALQRSLAS
ncbi:MAG: hypothetical protein WD751_01570 [Anaerolineales bacterium]